MSSTYIYLHTADAVQRSNPADSSWNLNFQNYDAHASYVSLEQVSIPLTVSPVNSNNNTLQLLENSGASDVTVTLAEQQYTGAEMATELKTKLDAATGAANTFTVTYSSNTKKLTITASATNFKFGSASTALKVIGFDANEAYATTQVSTNVVRLDGTMYMDIISSFSSNNICSNGRTNVLARIPIIASFGNVVTYQHANDSKIPIKNRELDVINIYLVDDTGNRVVMPEQSDISYVFRLMIE